MKEIKGILFDLDGVMYLGDKLIQGAIESICFVKERGMTTRFVTNTTRRSFSELFNKIQSLDLPIEKKELITAPKAAGIYLKHKNISKCFMVMKDTLKEEYEELTHTHLNPEAVVIGDIEEMWDYDILNQVFNHLMNGAELISLHKGKYWRDEKGLRIDLGAFTSALEYASGKKAIVMGKPSPEFFRLAVNDMGISLSEAIMIGDDINSDVGGAQNCGIRGVLVKTGKYIPEVAENSPVKPYAVIDSIKDLPNLFE